MSEPIRIKAHKAAVGMTVAIKGETGTWTLLSRHPKGGYWWVHRWAGNDWQTAAAHYSHMEQVIDNGRD